MKAGKKPDDPPTLLFKDEKSWAVWLEKHDHSSAGVWMRVAKKGSGLESVSYPEALEVAICYGWIDGQKQTENERTWLQKFLPRSEKSIWSKINREKALALVKSHRMRPAGWEAIERAKANSRWESAYDSPSRAAVPDDFQAALRANSRAGEFFEKLDRANRYA